MNNELKEVNNMTITPLLAARVVREYLLPMFKKGADGPGKVKKKLLQESESMLLRRSSSVERKPDEITLMFP